MRSSVVKIRIGAVSGFDYDTQMGDNVRVLRETRRAEADLAAAAVKDAT